MPAAATPRHRPAADPSTGRQTVSSGQADPLDNRHYALVAQDQPASDARLSAGLIAYVSGGHRPYPTRDEVALIQAVGEDVAVDLLPLLIAIVMESEQLAVDWMSVSREPWQEVEDEMRRRHGELTDEAIAALGRYWSYQMK